MYLLFLFEFFIISDVLFSNEVSFNVSIGFWSLNELFQKIQRQNSEQRIEEKFSLHSYMSEICLGSTLHFWIHYCVEHGML